MVFTKMRSSTGLQSSNAATTSMFVMTHLGPIVPGSSHLKVVQQCLARCWRVASATGRLTSRRPIPSSSGRHPAGCACLRPPLVSDVRQRKMPSPIRTAVVHLALAGIMGCTATAPSSRTAIQEVLAAEDEFVSAEVGRDEGALRRLVDDRFVRVLGNGSTYGKEELIQGVLKLRMSRQTLRERSAVIDDNVAVVIGTADVWFSHPDRLDTLSTFRYSSTYVRREGQWRMLSLHLSPRTGQ